jgi:hypothetical protein
MPILNYTTTIDPSKTAGEITKVLVKLGAENIGMSYEGGKLSGMAFAIRRGPDIYAFQLPVRVDAVLTVLKSQRGVPNASRTRAQAERVAWRIMKSWIEAQAAIIETQMVKLEQVMLPYMTTETGDTVFDRWEINNQLPAGASA